MFPSTAFAKWVEIIGWSKKLTENLARNQTTEEANKLCTRRVYKKKMVDCLLVC